MAAGDASRHGFIVDPRGVVVVLPAWVSSALLTVPAGPEPDELLVNVRRLVRGNVVGRLEGDDLMEPPLLDGLVQAVKPSGSFRGSGKGNGVPVNLDAIKKWKELDGVAREWNIARGVSMRGTLGSIIAAWVHEHRPVRRQELAEVSAWMVDQINELLSPPVPRRPLMKHCPECGQKWVTDEEGDRSPALTVRDRDPETGAMLPPVKMDVSCAACSEVWSGDKMTWVLQVLSNQWAGPVKLGA